MAAAMEHLSSGGTYHLCKTTNHLGQYGQEMPGLDFRYNSKFFTIQAIAPQDFFHRKEALQDLQSAPLVLQGIQPNLSHR